jgi:hypothetical protein
VRVEILLNEVEQHLPVTLQQLVQRVVVAPVEAIEQGTGLGRVRLHFGHDRLLPRRDQLFSVFSGALSHSGASGG